MKTLEKIIKIFPLATFLIIVASSIKLAVFYSVFNIKIVNYVGIAEYIPLFIDDLHVLLQIFGGMLLGFFLGKFSSKRIEKTDQNIINNKPVRIIYIITLIILLILAPIFIINFIHSTSERLDKLIGVFLFFMILIFMIGLTYNHRDKLLLISWIVVLITVPIILSGYQEAYAILENTNDHKYELLLENKTENSKDIIYIGKSAEYIFLYNKESKKSIIRPIKNLKEISIKKKPK